jgi:hypothetical protein
MNVLTIHFATAEVVLMELAKDKKKMEHANLS